MRRVRNWDVRLVEWQGRVLGEPFEWGRTDCASLVVGALEAMYDELPLEGPVPEYEGERDAVLAHKATGGVAEALAEGGADRVDLNFARQGDVLIGLPEQGGLPGAAVVVESSYVMASEDLGVLRRPLRGLREEDPDDLEVWRPPE